MAILNSTIVNGDLKVLNTFFSNDTNMSGAITSSAGSVDAFVKAAKDDGSVINSTNVVNASGLISAYTKDNKILLSTWPSSNNLVYLYSYTKTNVTNTNNTKLKGITWDSSTGELTADSFNGNLSGTAPTAPTAATSTNSTQIATTAYVKDCVPKSIGDANTPVYTDANGVITSTGKSFANYALLDSPALTGTPTAPTAALGTNTTQIATTAFVYQNSVRILNADTTIFVAYDGTGDGTTAAKAMSINDMWKYLASVRMEDASGGISNPKRLTIKFVPRASSASYGALGLYASKMPGIRFLTIDTSTGTNGTTSNYTTNCPYFSTITVNGGINVTIQNVQMTNGLVAECGASVTVQTYIGSSYFSSNTYAKLTFGNGVYNIHNANTTYLLRSYDYGFISVNTATATFNFRELCRYTGSIFRSETFGYMYLNYGRMKYTGTQPVVSITQSGTLSGTCSTAAGTAAKVLTTTAGSTTLSNGLVIYVKFSNDNTASNPTLNVDSTGAKPIYFGSTNIPANYLNKTIQYKMTYNTTSAAWVVNNTFNRVEDVTTSAYSGTSSNYNTTYNSGEWNWTGYGRNWTGNANINGTHYGTVNNYLPLSGGTVTGQVVLSKNTAGSGSAQNAVALIVGGAATAAHLELDPNGIMAKSNGTTITTLYLQDGNGCIYANTTAFAPNVTNKLTLGASGKVWTQLYANTTTIATSDARMKQDIEDIPDEVLDAWGEVNFRQFKFKDAVEEKGNENARIHMGLIAQRIKEVFEKHNLDPFKYGFFCYDEWDVHEDPKDENSPVIRRENGYALRYEEALIIEAAYQRRRLDRIEEAIKLLNK